MYLFTHRYMNTSQNLPVTLARHVLMLHKINEFRSFPSKDWTFGSRLSSELPKENRVQCYICSSNSDILKILLFRHQSISMTVNLNFSKGFFIHQCCHVFSMYPTVTQHFYLLMFPHGQKPFTSGVLLSRPHWNQSLLSQSSGKL